MAASIQSPQILTSNLQRNLTHTRAQVLLAFTPVVVSDCSPQMLLAGRHRRGMRHHLTSELLGEKNANFSGARHECKMGNLFLWMDVRSLGNVCSSNMQECDHHAVCGGEICFSCSFKNNVSRNRIMQLAGVDVSRVQTRRKNPGTSPASSRHLLVFNWSL